MLGKSILLGISVVLLAAAETDTRIVEAAQEGNRAQVKTLIAGKADVNGAQGDGTTALHWAAYKGDAEMTKMLLAAGADVKATTRVGRNTPLYLAAKAGDAKVIDALLAAGADPNMAEEHGTTPLMMAASSGIAAAVDALVTHGADVNVREGVHGQTALMFAANLNRVDAIRVLLAHGADPNIASRAVKLPKPGPRVDMSGQAPPPEAAAPKPAPAAANAAATADQKAALDTLASAMGLKGTVYSQGKASENEIKDLVTKLSAKVDAIEKRLPAEKKAGADDMMFFDRDRGTQDVGGLTPLIYAAREGHIEAARALLEGGADINAASASEHTTALVMAIMNGHYDIAKFLVDYGANPNIANNLGLAPLYGTIDVQWAPKGWYPSPVTTYEKTNYLDLMKALLVAGADPNARTAKKLWFRHFGDHTWIDDAGSTAFFRAAMSSDIFAMKLLVQYGADPNLPSAHGITPLMVASGYGWGYHYNMNLPDSWMEAVRYCIEMGADVNAVDDKGYTALHGAAFLGNNEMVQYLVDLGADVKAVAKDKNTIADMANGPQRFGPPHADTLALVESLGSANSHNCRSDQCLVAAKPAAGAPVTAAPAPVSKPAAVEPKPPAAKDPAKDKKNGNGQ